jgi:hypothetical protein
MRRKRPPKTRRVPTAIPRRTQLRAAPPLSLQTSVSRLLFFRAKGIVLLQLEILEVGNCTWSVNRENAVMHQMACSRQASKPGISFRPSPFSFFSSSMARA